LAAVTALPEFILAGKSLLRLRSSSLQAAAQEISKEFIA
jgi:hypothetical protein